MKKNALFAIALISLAGCTNDEFVGDPELGEANGQTPISFSSGLTTITRADKTELNDNIRVARVLLHSFVDMYIRINEHLLIIGHKNPEYTINGKLGDRKGVESENGIKSAFRKAKLQGCKVVVLDFDMHMSESILKTRKIVSGLLGRHEDFSDGLLDECYVVHNSKAVVVSSANFSSPDKAAIKQIISEIIEKLRT